MNIFQRWFLIASLTLLAAGSGIFCLDYRVIDAGSPEGRMRYLVEYGSPEDREIAKNILLKTYGLEEPLVDFGWTHSPCPPSDDCQAYIQAQQMLLRAASDGSWGATDGALGFFRGVYSHPGLTQTEARIGGFLLPVLCLIGAIFLGLGALNRKELPPVTARPTPS